MYKWCLESRYTFGIIWICIFSCLRGISFSTWIMFLGPARCGSCEIHLIEGFAVRLRLRVPGARRKPPAFECHGPKWERNVRSRDNQKLNFHTSKRKLNYSSVHECLHPKKDRSEFQDLIHYFLCALLRKKCLNNIWTVAILTPSGHVETSLFPSTILHRHPFNPLQISPPCIPHPRKKQEQRGQARTELAQLEAEAIRSWLPGDTFCRTWAMGGFVFPNKTASSGENVFGLPPLPFSPHFHPTCW